MLCALCRSFFSTVGCEVWVYCLTELVEEDFEGVVWYMLFSFLRCCFFPSRSCLSMLLPPLLPLLFLLLSLMLLQ